MHYSFRSTQSWSMQGKTEGCSQLISAITKINRTESRPGPGTYDIKPIYKNFGVVSPTNDKRQIFKISGVPGPGQYQSHSFTQDGALSKKMGCKLNDSPIKPTPGPMDYNQNISAIIKKNPQFSLSNRSKSYQQFLSHKNHYKPSPTQYNPEKLQFHKTVSAFIGSSKRINLTQTQETPAPNKYHQTNTQNKTIGFKFGGQIRNKNKSNQNIGPNSYEKKSLFQQNIRKSKGPSFGAKLNKESNLQKSSKNPGPGSYTHSLINKPTAPEFSPGKTQRMGIIDSKSHKIVPGPGQHKPQLCVIKFRSTSGSSFPKASKFNQNEMKNTPSPGQYNNYKKQVLRYAPKFTIPKQGNSKTHFNHQQLKPAPTQYNPTVTLTKQSIIAHKLPLQIRQSLKKNDNPGPNFYQLKGTSQGPQWHFSKNQRFPNKKRENDVLLNIRKPIADPPKYMNIHQKYKFSPKNKVYE